MGEILLNEIKKDRKYFKSKNVESSADTLIADVIDMGIFNYNDYKEQLKNIKKIVIVGNYETLQFINFPIEELEIGYDVENYENISFINCNNIKKLTLYSCLDDIKNISMNLDNLETLFIYNKGIDHIFSNKFKSLKKLVIFDDNKDNLEFDVENFQIKLFKWNDNKIILSLFKDGISIKYDIYLNNKIDKKEVEIKSINSDTLNISDIVNKYHPSKIDINSKIRNCNKILINTHDLDNLKYIDYQGYSIREIEVVDNDDMRLIPQKVNFKLSDYEMIYHMYFKKDNIYIILNGEYKFRYIVIRKDLSIEDLSKSDTLYISDVEAAKGYIPENLTKLVFDKPIVINSTFWSGFLYEILKSETLNEIEFTDNSNFKELSNQFPNMKINTLTFPFGQNFEYKFSNMYYFFERNVIKRKHKDQIIKIKYNQQIEQIHLSKDKSYIIKSNEDLLTVTPNNKSKNNSDDLQFIFKIVNGKLKKKQKKFYCEKNDVIESLDFEYLDKLNKLGIDRRVLYYTYYLYKNNYPFKDIKEVLDNLIVNLGNGKYDLEDIKNINNYGNTLVKSIRR